MGDVNESMNSWDIIDTFFRDTENYKSQHQIDSFNEFIFSEENGIKNIIRRENPFILLKGESKDSSSFRYKIEIFFGEELDKVSGDVIEGKEHIYIASPSIHGDKDMKYMYPNEARIKDLTYQSSVLCDIGVRYTFNEVNERIVVRNFPKMNLGHIPIMIHSKMCILHKIDPIKLSELGECPYDHGGYFVIKGKEKIVKENKVHER